MISPIDIHWWQWIVIEMVMGMAMYLLIHANYYINQCICWGRIRSPVKYLKSDPKWCWEWELIGLVFMLCWLITLSVWGALVLYRIYQEAHASEPVKKDDQMYHCVDCDDYVMRHEVAHFKDKEEGDVLCLRCNNKMHSL